MAASRPKDLAMAASYPRKATAKLGWTPPPKTPRLLCHDSCRTPRPTQGSTGHFSIYILALRYVFMVLSANRNGGEGEGESMPISEGRRGGAGRLRPFVANTVVSANCAFLCIDKAPAIVIIVKFRASLCRTLCNWTNRAGK